MATKSVEFHEEAVREYRAAVEWYHAHSVLVATHFTQQVARAIELIADAPQRWPSYSANTRKFVLRQFPFLVIYRDLPGYIQVLAVAHAHRRPGYWKSRS